MIWFTQLDLEQAQLRSKNTLAEHCQIEFMSYDEQSLTARMPVIDQTKQPIGILHGGASCVLAETVGSTASNYCVDQATQFCVGLEININHIKQIRNGYVTAIAKPIHLGKSTHVWSIDLYDDQQSRSAISRLTMAVLNRKKS